MNNKINVAVISGGPSAEHEVSIDSGKNITAALEKSGQFKVRPITINKKGQWLLDDKAVSPLTCLRGVDVVFNALHGEFGEDGTIQGFLDTISISYTGAGLVASAVGMNKLLTKLLGIKAGIRMPEYIFIEKKNGFNSLPFSYPVVIKPNSRGSSVGVSIVKNKKDLDQALRLAFKYDNQVLIEKFIPGREITVGVLENWQGRRHFVLPITEVRPNEKFDFFNYEAKYTAGASKEITPAKLPLNIKKQAEELAVKLFKIVGARHYSRVDMIYGNDNKVYVLEINTLPGMTKNSLVPQQAAAAGLPLDQLVEHLIKLAMNNY
jgi:D-alanine-D-alanine ligase